jgi:hypothetical protein
VQPSLSSNGLCSLPNIIIPVFVACTYFYCSHRQEPHALSMSHQRINLPDHNAYFFQLTLKRPHLQKSIQRQCTCNSHQVIYYPIVKGRGRSCSSRRVVPISFERSLSIIDNRFMNLVVFITTQGSQARRLLRRYIGTITLSSQRPYCPTAL